MENSGVQVEVYKHDNPNQLIDILHERANPAAVDEINDNGGGGFQISKYTEKYQENPDILETRNYCKIRTNGKVSGGFIISSTKPALADSGEASAEIIEVAGEGPASWLQDAEVYPPVGFVEGMNDTRAFNFATERGAWYKPADWITPYKMYKWGDVPASPWRYAPAEWPDAPNAWWIWTHNALPTVPDGESAYFRYEFTVPSTGDYKLFVGADDFYSVYVDGQEVLVAGADTYNTTWQETRSAEFKLEAGPHVIGIGVINVAGPASLIAALFRFGNAASQTSAQLITTTGDPGWVACQGDKNPGWTIGEILLKLLQEAYDRGVKFPGWLTPTFTATADSAGVPWERKVNWSFNVGDSYFDVLQRMEEVEVDFWVNPDTLQFSVQRERGTDRSVQTSTTDPISFEVGKNLISAEAEIRGNIKNSIVVKHADGWSVEENSASIAKYGKLEGKFEIDAPAAGAKAIIAKYLDRSSKPEAGVTYEIVPIEGTVPNKDFFVGDWVLAPNYKGVLEKVRVASISVGEDKAGNPVYAVEFGTIFQSEEVRLARAVEKLQMQSGGGLSNSSVIPGGAASLGGGTVIRRPGIPSNLQVSSIGSWNNDGTATSTATVQWTAVNLNTDGSSVTTALQYEVQGKRVGTGDETWRQYAIVPADVKATITGFVPGSSWLFRVRAFNLAGYSSDWLVSSEHIMTAPASVLYPPTDPILTTTLGILVVQWNGKLKNLSTELDPPGQFTHVQPMLSLTETGTYSPVGASLSSAGTTPIADLTVGTTYWIKLRAFDRYGTPSADSAAKSIVVQGIDLEQISQEALNEISEMVGSNGQKVIYAPSAPPATDPPGSSYLDGDTWFVRNTTNGQITAQYERRGSTWVIVQLSHQVISSIDAGKITVGLLEGSIIKAGTIVGEKLAANSITTEKLVAGSVTGTILSGDAINGKTITGAIIQTSAQANRGIKLDLSGFRLYSATGEKIVDMNPNGVSIIGRLESTTSASANSSGQIIIGPDVYNGGTGPADAGIRAGILINDPRNSILPERMARITATNFQAAFESPVYQNVNAASDRRRAILMLNGQNTSLIATSIDDPIYNNVPASGMVARLNLNTTGGISLSYHNGSTVTGGTTLNLHNSTGIRFDHNGNQVGYLNNDGFRFGREAFNGRLVSWNNPGVGGRMDILTNFGGVGGGTRLEGFLDVTGNFWTGGTKSFLIDHPEDPLKRLEHAATESPSSGVEYWNGHSQNEALLDENGECVIQLPEYFEALTDKDNRSVLVCPIGKPYLIGTDEIIEGSFKVYGEPNRRFSWNVKASRAGYYFDSVRDKTEEELRNTFTPDQVMDQRLYRVVPLPR